jgi:hypothetical protein
VYALKIQWQGQNKLALIWKLLKCQACTQIHPEKQTYENGANFFSPLRQYPKKSQKRKALASVESRMGGKKEKIWHCLPFSYKPAARCSNQSINSSKKKTYFCPDKADAN